MAAENTLGVAPSAAPPGSPMAPQGTPYPLDAKDKITNEPHEMGTTIAQGYDEADQRQIPDREAKVGAYAYKNSLAAARQAKNTKFQEDLVNNQYATRKTYDCMIELETQGLKENKKVLQAKKDEATYKWSEELQKYYAPKDDPKSFARKGGLRDDSYKVHQRALTSNDADACPKSPRENSYRAHGMDGYKFERYNHNFHANPDFVKDRLRKRGLDNIDEQTTSGAIKDTLDEQRHVLLKIDEYSKIDPQAEKYPVNEDELLNMSNFTRRQKFISQKKPEEEAAAAQAPAQ